MREREGEGGEREERERWGVGEENEAMHVAPFWVMKHVFV